MVGKKIKILQFDKLHILYQIFGMWVQHTKKTGTQSDIRFCENEGSNRFKINEKGGHLDRKYRRKFIQYA